MSFRTILNVMREVLGHVEEAPSKVKGAFWEEDSKILEVMVFRGHVFFLLSEHPHKDKKKKKN